MLRDVADDGKRANKVIQRIRGLMKRKPMRAAETRYDHPGSHRTRAHR